MYKHLPLFRARVLSHDLHTPKVSPSLMNFSKRKDPTASANALSLSSKLKSLVLGNQIHAQIIKVGFCNDTFSQNNLIIMYSKCGVISDGLKMFVEMRERNLVSWTSMISGAIQNGKFETGMRMYLDMFRTGLNPNEFALGSVLQGCASLEDVEFGLSIHCFALKIGMEDNLFVGCSILNMYCKCGYVGAAEQVFECLDDPDIASWNAMIGGYAINGHIFKAVGCINLMHLKRKIMDEITFMNALKGCSISGNSNIGRQIHGLIIHAVTEFSLPGMNSLLDMYLKTGGKESALKVFSKMEVKDIISWNTLFVGFSEDDDAGAVSLFCEMLSTGLKPNHVSFSILFKLCGKLLDISLGLQFYCLTFHLGFSDEALVTNSLINMFSKCGVMEMAHLLFESAPNNCIITWNEMISGFNLNCYSIKALEIFQNLRDLEVEANECTYCGALGACSTPADKEIGKQIHGIVIKSGFSFHPFVSCSLINAYARFGLIEDSFKIFAGIQRLDLVSWGSMIAAFGQQGYNYEALALFKHLKEAGEKPDEFILASVLNSCANIAAHNQTKSIHLLVIKSGLENHVFVVTAVIDAYAKGGHIENSRLAFDCSIRYADAVLFNAMIMAYAQHGRAVEAIEIFEKMKRAGLQPNLSTFVSFISACGYLGLVDQGRMFFKSISLEYGMDPSPYNFGCLVDLLSRNGLIEEAKHVIDTMPFRPWPEIWKSLLSGCRIHGNRKMGEWVAKQLFQLVPANDAAYVLLLKIYSEEGRWEDAAKISMMMTERRVCKERGYSQIEI